MAEYIFSDHARFRLARRGLSEALVRRVLDDPEQRFEVRPGREVRQSVVVAVGDGARYLLRVLVDVDRVPAEVVTSSTINSRIP